MIAYVLIPYIKAKTYNTKYGQLLVEVGNIVRSLQQVMGDSKEYNSTKRQQAIEYISEYALNHHINLTVEQIEMLVEAAVYGMKSKQIEDTEK